MYITTASSLDCQVKCYAIGYTHREQCYVPITIAVIKGDAAIVMCSQMVHGVLQSWSSTSTDKE